MFNCVLRFGSELPLLSIVGVLGVQDGELGTDGPRRSGCGDEPEVTKETSGSQQQRLSTIYKSEFHDLSRNRDFMVLQQQEYSADYAKRVDLHII